MPPTIPVSTSLPNNVVSYHQLRCQYCSLSVLHINYTRFLSVEVEPTLKIILNELATVKHKWREICIQLGSDNSKLHEFSKMNHDNPLIEGVDYWLKDNTNVPITWRSVVAALESPCVGEPGLAKTLREKWIKAADKETKQTCEKTGGMQIM